jgi:hypothetical protein
MLSKLYNLVAIPSIALLLAGSGFLGYLGYSGKLTGERLEEIAAVLRAGKDDKAADAADDGADASGNAAQTGGGAQSADAIREARRQSQLRRAVLERAASDASARKALVDQSLQHLVTLQERFEIQKAEWVRQKAALAAEARDRGFKKELEYLEKLPPKQAKEHVLRSWEKHKADAVRLFMAMAPRTGQRILEELKSPKELEVLHELLEQLRLADVDQFAAESRKNPRDAQP